MWEAENPNEKLQLYDHMFSVDIEAANFTTKKYFTDMSFTFIAWRVIDAIDTGILKFEYLSRVD